MIANEKLVKSRTRMRRTPAPEVAVSMGVKQAHGIKVTKVGPSNTTHIPAEDIRNLIFNIHQLDNNVIIMNHKKDPKTAVHPHQIRKWTMQRYIEFMDVKTLQLGRGKGSREVTMFTFYYLFNQKTNPFEISNHPLITNWKRQVGTRLSEHRLKESSSIELGYLLGKDPQHGERSSVANRLENWYNGLLGATEPHIPMQVTKRCLQTADGFSTPALVVMVGTSDAPKMEPLFRSDNPSHRHPMLHCVPRHIRRNPQEFKAALMKHHNMIQQGKAFRIENIKPKDIEMITLSLRNSGSILGASLVPTTTTRAGALNPSSVWR